MIYYSVVVPMKDEQDNVELLVNEIEPVMKRLNKPWELIIVNDGSTDGTADILNKLLKEKDYLKVITFEKNYGQSSAFDAGFKAAAGEFVITLDGDGQNDPADIPKLIEKSSAYDLICGQRLNRKDPFGKKIISSGANFIRSRICSDGMTDTGCSLKLYRTACLKQLKLYDGMHRFLPALFKIEEFRIGQVPVNHRERKGGTTKYTLFNRSFNTIVDMWAVWWMGRRKLKYKVREEK